MKTYVWHRTGFVVLLVAGAILFLLIFLGPFVYAWRTGKLWIAHRRARWIAHRRARASLKPR